MARIREVGDRLRHHVDQVQELTRLATAAVTDSPAEVISSYEDTVRTTNLVLTKLKEEEYLLAVEKPRVIDLGTTKRVNLQQYAKHLLETGRVQGWQELSPNLYVSAALQLVQAKLKLYAEDLQQLQRGREKLLSSLRKLVGHIEAARELGLCHDTRVPENLVTLAQYLMRQGAVVGREAQRRHQQLQHRVTNILGGRDFRAVFGALAKAYAVGLEADCPAVIARRKQQLRQELARELVAEFDQHCRELQRTRHAKLSEAIAQIIQNCRDVRIQ